MDDLLIVRASERARPRRHQRRAQVPLGANLGIVIGASCGLVGMTQFPNNPPIGLVAGIGIGIVIGGIIGPLLRPKSKRPAQYPNKHYDGMPFPEADAETIEK